MKDKDTLNEVWISEMWEDFDGFIAKKDWKNCEAIIETVGNFNYENDAIRMNHVLNRESGEMYFEPIEDSEIPFITPEEDDEEILGVFPESNRDDRFFNSKEI